MAADLAGTPVSGPRVQLCGDAHLANFGIFAAPDRRLVFDVNDFDETLAGPWEWDVKRLAASIAVAGRDRGFGGRARRDAVRATARAYRKAMRHFAAMRTIDVWYARLDEDRVSQYLSSSQRKDLGKAAAKARRKDSLRALAKLTYEVEGQPRIVSDPPLVVPIAELAGGEDAERVRERLGSYLRDYQKTLQHNRRHLLGGLPPRRRRAQGGRRGQRGHALLDRAAARAATPPTRCSFRSRRPSPRSSRPTRRAAAGRSTRAGASSRASS